MNALSKYTYSFKNSWQYHLEYQVDNLIRFGIVFIALVSTIFLWENVFAQKASVMGYGKEQMITYYLMVSFLFSSIYSVIPIAEEIQNGTLSIYVVKPINYLMQQYWISLAKRIFRLLLGLPILVLIFIIFHKSLFIVTDPWAYVLLLVTGWGAINILFLFDVIIGSLEFWIFNSSSVQIISNLFVSFFAGTLLPIFLLPHIFQTISNFLPFKYAGFFIIDSFMGKSTGTQILMGIGMQLLWTGVLIILVSLIWKAGMKKFEAVGN